MNRRSCSLLPEMPTGRAIHLALTSTSRPASFTPALASFRNAVCASNMSRLCLGTVVKPFNASQTCAQSHTVCSQSQALPGPTAHTVTGAGTRMPLLMHCMERFRVKGFQGARVSHH